MDDIEKAVSELCAEDLDVNRRVVCYRDVAAGMDWVDCLHDFEDMQEGITHSDMICPHCYVTDDEFGLDDLSDDLSKMVFGDIEKFDKYRNARAGN